MKFQDDILNMNTYIHTYIRTSRNQYVLHFFKVGGIKNKQTRKLSLTAEKPSLSFPTEVIRPLKQRFKYHLRSVYSILNTTFNTYSKT